MNSWDKFLREVDQQRDTLGLGNGEECFFRGQGSQDWPLLPTLLRHCRAAGIVDNDSILDLEANLYFEFRARARELHGERLTGWDILFYMRHHGVATRLLDWTEVLGVAVFFAVKDAEKSSSNPCVWLLNPYRLNEVSYESRDLVAPEYMPRGRSDFGDYLVDYPEGAGFDWEKPIALYPLQKSTRLQSQRGYFTIHGNDPRPLQEICPEVLRKVILPRAAFPRARKFLDAAGINEFLLFPDLDGLARHLHSKYGISEKPRPR